MEESLSRTSQPEEMRTTYAAAYREVTNLIRNEGEAAVWRRITSY